MSDIRPAAFLRAEGSHLLMQGLLDVRQAALQHSHVLLYPHPLCLLFLYGLSNFQALTLQVLHTCHGHHDSRISSTSWHI